MEEGGVLGRRKKLMSRLEMRHLHQQVMKPKSRSGERQGWGGRQGGGGRGQLSKSKVMAGPQCHAEELGLYIEGIGKSLRNF